ncbi:response regulator [Pseudoduganella eburnea]|uniref:Response regulator n=1 Tax=Massilia eburnea TaxID=1776165 RepID=A0A6L6QC97_9BURK|nr:response regulator [Massilia eburnea]MTW10138.1 response regulator [Massilia eburnea]
MARILIIEDSPINMELLTFLLANEGHELFLAERALPGIEIARQQPLDLILMDVTMPDVGGIEAAKMLRAHPNTRTVPLIAVTAMAMSGDKERIIAEGFDEYIAKPVDFAQLLEKVARFTGQSPSSDSDESQGT